MKLTIISGGQTGVDQAALDWARRRGWPHTGWCPAGRRSETGEIPGRFHLQETPSDAVGERTLWNVRDSDATVLFASTERLSGGTAQTARFCFDLDRPVVLLAASVFTVGEASILLRRFVARHGVRRLNVAGPRASQDPAAGRFATAVLRGAFPASPAPRATISAVG